MAKKGQNEIVAMICQTCKSQNYVTTRNKINMDAKAGGKAPKFEIKKFCKKCRKIEVHKETTKLK